MSLWSAFHLYVKLTQAAESLKTTSMGKWCWEINYHKARFWDSNIDLRILAAKGRHSAQRIKFHWPLGHIYSKRKQISSLSDVEFMKYANILFNQMSNVGFIFFIFQISNPFHVLFYRYTLHDVWRDEYKLWSQGLIASSYEMSVDLTQNDSLFKKYTSISFPRACSSGSATRPSNPFKQTSPLLNPI